MGHYHSNPLPLTGRHNGPIAKSGTAHKFSLEQIQQQLPDELVHVISLQQPVACYWRRRIQGHTIWRSPGM